MCKCLACFLQEPGTFWVARSLDPCDPLMVDESERSLKGMDCWRDETAFKGIYYSFRGPEFCTRTLAGCS